jgi:hypothetical protein
MLYSQYPLWICEIPIICKDFLLEDRIFLQIYQVFNVRKTYLGDQVVVQTTFTLGCPHLSHQCSSFGGIVRLRRVRLADGCFAIISYSPLKYHSVLYNAMFDHNLLDHGRMFLA